MNQIDNSWTTKYRPHKFEDIIGNTSIVNSIKTMMPNITHILLKGPPGVGKTTLALVIVETLGCVYKEINASDENKVETIRTTVKNFAMNTSLGDKYKVLILDEADNLTSDAQAILRRIMEKYAHNCKFIITCNYPEKLIEPIHSRCKGANFELKPIQIDEFIIGIRKILAKEEMIIDDDAILALYEKCKGDMRVVDELYRISNITKHITLEHINETKDDNTHKNIIKCINDKNYIGACQLIEDKHVLKIFNEFMSSNIDDEKKCKLSHYFAEYDFRKYFSKTKYVQLYALVGNVMDVLYKDDKKEIVKYKSPFA